MDEQPVTFPENVTAAAKLKAILANRPLADGTMLNPAGVEIRVDLKNTQFRLQGEPEIKEVLTIAIKDPRVDSMPLAISNAVKKALGEIPALKDIQFESNAEHANTLHTILADLMTKGADIPKNYLEWSGFKPSVAEEKGPGTELQLHALKIEPNELGVGINIHIPLGKEEQENSKVIVEAIKTNLEGRLSDIKDMLVKRIGKYQGIPKEEKDQSEAQKAQLAEIKQKVDALNFEISTTEYNKQDHSTTPAQISISVLSPKQTDEKKDLIKFMGKTEAEKKEIKDSNILSALTVEQLGKALGRSFLHAGDTANEVFPRIAGREDMKRAVIKSLVRLKKAKSELTQEVDAFLNDDTFKNHETWNTPKSEQPQLKARPEPEKHKAGELNFHFTLPDGKSAQIISDMAKMEIAGSPELPPAESVLAKIGPDNIAQILAQGPAENKQAQLAKEALSTTSGRNVG